MEIEQISKLNYARLSEAYNKSGYNNVVCILVNSSNKNLDGIFMDEKYEWELININKLKDKIEYSFYEWTFDILEDVIDTCSSQCIELNFEFMGD